MEVNLRYLEQVRAIKLEDADYLSVLQDNAVQSFNLHPGSFDLVVNGSVVDPTTILQESELSDDYPNVDVVVTREYQLFKKISLKYPHLSFGNGICFDLEFIAKELFASEDDVLVDIIDFINSHNDREYHLIEILFDFAKRGTDKNLDLILKYISVDSQSNSSNYEPLLCYIISKTRSLEKVKRLLKYKPDLNLGDHEGNSPLIKAIMYNSTDIVDLLLSTGADIHKCNYYVENALFFSLSSAQFPTLKKLISLGIDVNKQTIDKRTPLWCTYLLETAEELIKAGADVNVRDIDGVSALEKAIRTGRSEMVEMLIRAGARDLCALDFVIRTNRQDLLEYLLEKDINLQNRDGNTALHVAVKYKNKRIIEDLLEEGINPGIRNNNGELALNSLFNEDQGRIINSLIRGQNINLRVCGPDRPLSRQK